MARFARTITLHSPLSTLHSSFSTLHSLVRLVTLGLSKLPYTRTMKWMIPSVALMALVLTSCQAPSVSDTESTVVEYSQMEKDSMVMLGKDLAMKTKGILGSNLIPTLTKYGADSALTFCNLEAIPLTDSASGLLGATIYRVSDQPRNPDNRAVDDALEFILAGKEIVASGGEVKPALHINNDGSWRGFYPIMTNAMCLNCHGTPETEVSASTLALIAEHYPEDEALGYADAQLRGIFVVERK